FTDAAVVTIDPADISGGTGTYVRVEFVYDNGTPADPADDIRQDSGGFSFATTNVLGGNVSVTVYDDQGCSATTNAVIPAFNALSLSATPITVTKAIDCRALPVGGEEIRVSVDLTSALVLGEDLIFTITGAGGFTATNTINGPSTGTTVSSNFTGLGTGTYDIDIRNVSTGCIISTSHQVLDVPSFILDIARDNNVACLTDTNGSLTFDFAASSPYAGAYDYEVFLSGGTTTGITGTVAAGASPRPTTVNTLGAGTYYVEVTMRDNPFCPVTSPEVIIEAPSAALSFTFTNNPITCFTSTSGDVNISATGGWGSYEYQLENTTTSSMVQPFSTNSIIGGLTSGNYLITVQDANGCVITDTFTLVDPTTIAATPTVTTQIACEGDTTAVITVSGVSGGAQVATPVYSYSLLFPDGTETAIQTSNQFTGLGAGDYTVTVYDEFNCRNTFPITITEPTDVMATAAITSTISCTRPNATVEVTGSGGTGAYTYSNDGTSFGTSNSFSVPPGDHEFFVRDANGCTSLPFTVSIPALEPLMITLDTSAAFISCNGNADAVLSATTTGGLGNNMYELIDASGAVVDGPQVSSVFTGIAPGTYRIRVTSQDCVAETTPHRIDEPALLETTETVVNVSCNGETDGTIMLSTIGGTAPYVYEIDTEPGRFQTQNEFNNLAAGDYRITVLDLNGCINIVDVTIIEPTPIVASIDTSSIVQQECVTDPTPSFTVNMSGGTPPYTLRISDGRPAVTLGATETSYTFTNLNAGQFYEVLVTDSRNCPIPSNLTIQFDPALDLQFNAEVMYECDGQIVINATVAEIYEDEVVYMISGPESATNDTGVFNVSALGTYTVEVSHVDGCNPPPIQVDVIRVDPLVLNVDDSQINMFIVSGSGGQGPYEYSIDGSDFSSEDTFVITETRDYTITVRDSRGCETTLIVPGVFITIEIPNLFTPDGDSNQDYWYPINVQPYHNIKVYIYDRYGRQIQTYEGVTQGWDGTYQERPLPSGDYWYRIEYTEITGEERRIMGHFTLYR
ncbi:T9SS type B sorting domain-containing protein, partial [Tenacibaculum agarivorans]|uniref:T9SS type B sorting domain-containing protein n=1 Tax=Tenacibaculum agarivorans TaxID=1908389 RepID=UPI000A7A49F2